MIWPRRLIGALWPRFFRTGPRLGPYASLRSYPRAWMLTVALLSSASVIPVIVVGLLDYRFTRRVVEREHELQIIKLVSNARRTTAHFLEERLEALLFTAHELGRERLSDSTQLAAILGNLKRDFGGLSDLGVIDETGRQVSYCGPYDLSGKDYGAQEWFASCRERGAFVSDVFLGYRDVPHVVIAVKASPKAGSFFFLRATLDVQPLRDSLARYAPSESDDIFLVNGSGVIQTPSLHHGGVLEKLTIAVPAASDHTEVQRVGGGRQATATMGYAYVTTRLADTPFVLLLFRGRADVGRFASWLLTSRLVVVGCTVLGIVLVMSVVSSYMFNRLLDADLAKAHALGRMEDVNRLVSLGRLAAGVAHEINNPLAVIKESAGYMQDLLDLGGTESHDQDFREQMESILDSVDRCGGVTRQLLLFSRRPDFSIGPVDLRETIVSVLGFQEKEAEYRNITTRLEIAEDANEIETDRRRLQEVLLNLVMNAFDAMPGGGTLVVSARRHGEKEVSIEVSDTGVGMSEEVRKSVFEPFFTTKGEGEGTGLGLSISYGIVDRLGGRISVESEVGVGSRFRVRLPIRTSGGAST